MTGHGEQMSVEPDPLCEKPALHTHVAAPADEKLLDGQEMHVVCPVKD